MSGQGPENLFQYRVELEANKLKQAADSLPQGGEREALLDRAHRMNMASNIVEQWASSPGLRAPRHVR